MFDHDEERIGRLLRRLLSKSGIKVERTGCPDEEHLANYLSGHLAEDAVNSLKTHLANCTFCTDALVAAHKAMQEPITEKVPQRVINRAMALIPQSGEQAGVFDLTLRFVKDSLELVSTSGQWIGPMTVAPVGVRGKTEPSETTILQVEKEMGRFKVAVEVERLDTDMCQVGVKLTGKDRKPADGIRVSLVSGGREQASYLTKEGEAIFDRIPQGEYNLALSEAGAPVGVIRLKME